MEEGGREGGKESATMVTTMQPMLANCCSD